MSDSSIFSALRALCLGVLCLGPCACKNPSPQKNQETDSNGSTGPNDTSSGEGSTATTATDSDCPVNPGGWGCDPWCQDCKDGQKCIPAIRTVDPPDATCVPVPPVPKQQGELCSSEGTVADECAKGLACLGTDLQLKGSVCAQLCTGTPKDPKCANDAERCFLSSNDALAVCLPVCDPLAQDCPYPGDRCWLHDPDCADAACLPMGLRGTTNCILDPAPDTVYNSTCFKQHTCSAGQACLASDHMAACVDPVGCCSPLCDLNDQQFVCPDSDKGMKCLRVFSAEATPAKLAHLGVCRLP